MAIPFLNVILNFRKPHLRRVPKRHHLMLFGINQRVFLKELGEPETQICLNPVGRFKNLGTLFLITDPTEEASLSVWIYKKKDSILFFTKKKLIAHFSCKNSDPNS
jgi:hypothetical protein